jgi:hypothetical protein
MSGMLGYIYTSLSSKIQKNRIRLFNNLALSPYFLSVKELDKAWYLDICIQFINMSCSNIHCRDSLNTYGFFNNI